MADNILDTLIYDRTQADVNRARYLNGLWDARAGRWRGTSEEWAEWAAGPRGAYGFNDMNRVNEAIGYLVGQLTLMGYSIDMEGVIPIYNIRVIVSPSGSGIASGDGAIQEGDEVTVSAAPSEKYDFVGWMESGELVSENLTYTFAVDRSRTLTAAFALKQFMVALSIDPAGSGETTGGGMHDIDSEVTIAATAGDGYIFARWAEGREAVSESSEYTFLLDGNRSFTAVMAKVWVIALSANNGDFGTFAGAGTYLDGQEVTLSAVAADGYGFAGWQENGETISTDEVYSFPATADREIVAVFAKEHVITVDVYPPEWGTAQGGGTYLEGQEVTVNAEPGNEYRFLYWVEDFEPGTEYEITADAQPEEAGAVRGAGSYPEGSTVVLTATANDGWYFTGWNEFDEE